MRRNENGPISLLTHAYFHKKKFFKEAGWVDPPRILWYGHRRMTDRRVVAHFPEEVISPARGRSCQSFEPVLSGDWFSFQHTTLALSLVVPLIQLIRWGHSPLRSDDREIECSQII